MGSLRIVRRNRIRLRPLVGIIPLLLLLAGLTACSADSATTAVTSESGEPDTTAETTTIADYEWTRIVTDAPWGKRAGLRVVEFDNSLFLLGGRTPRQSTIPGDSDIWSDVWRSDDSGTTWTQILDNDDAASWPGRAYFQAVVKDDRIIVLGGQDYGLEPNPYCALLEQGLKPPPGLGIDPDAPCPEFLPTSQFFNDVWSSPDGVSWTQLTDKAPWDGRAGLSAAVLGDHIYVLAGSQNDDSSIIGPGGPARIYYNDVWRSADGAEWELLTEAAPWEPRAGAVVVAQGDALWLLGGEDGFTCEPLPDCDVPYFNDVWTSTDGANWEQVSAAAEWSERPGHQCEIIGGGFFCFGGFDPVGNPMDQWHSIDGSDWTEVDGVPWNAESADDIKYDFEAITTTADGSTAILTFGGDRETFDFDDPDNYLRADADVWMFAPAE